MVPVAPLAASNWPVAPTIFSFPFVPLTSVTAPSSNETPLVVCELSTVTLYVPVALVPAANTAFTNPWVQAPLAEAPAESWLQLLPVQLPTGAALPAPAPSISQYKEFVGVT